VSRVTRIAALSAALVVSMPRVAFASERLSPTSFTVHVGVSLIGLVVAAGLLVETLALRKLAHGGAVAEKMSLVILAIICLAASALAEWGTNFVVDLTLEQVQLASEVLAIVAMALLAAYFWTVRSGMSDFLRSASEAPPSTAPEPAADDEEDERA
jgi:hypothetical protein